jgi:uncharacterized membrane protein
MARLKSPVFWVGMISLFYIIAGNYGLYEIMGISEENVRMIIDIIMGLFGGFAVANNPTDSEHF